MEKKDGITLEKDNISLHFTFDKFNCVVERLAEELTATREEGEKEVTREEARTLVLEDKIEMPQLLHAIDTCTLEYFKKKKLEEALRKAYKKKEEK